MVRNLSLNAKLSLLIGLVTLVLLAASFGLISLQQARVANELTEAEARELGYHYAGVVAQPMNEIMQASQSVASSILIFKHSAKFDRAQLSEWLKSVLVAHPSALGAWIVMEPDAFDGKDKEFAGKAESDKTGRVLHYWNRDGNGGYAYEPVAGYEDTGPDGAFYWLPRQKMKPVVTEPFLYKVAGKDVMMVSMIVPIIENGKFIGVSGVDLSTEGIWKQLSAVHPVGTGSLNLISNEGNWAGYPAPEQWAKPIDGAAPELGAAKAAIQRGEFQDITGKDASGTALRRVFAPVIVGDAGTPWSVLVNLPLAQIDAPKDGLQFNTVLASLVTLVLLLAALGLVSRYLVGQPLRRTASAVERLASGDLTVQIADQDRGDEIGQINGALDLFKANAVRVTELEQDRQREELTARDRRKAELDGLAARFEGSVGDVVRSVAEEAGRMQSSALALTDIARETDSLSAAVASASELATMNVQTVAAATEQLSNSIAEINSRMGQSAKLADDAVSEVARTDELIASLSSAADNIGAVVNLIQGIAAQTNLLALNATIEAARAGDAGKGFAVVASEVKNLANQTAQATQEISGQITSMQDATSKVVGAIHTVSERIRAMSETSTSIAAAAEQQGAATQEISRNVQQVAVGAGEVSQNIQGVTQAAQRAGAMADQVLSAAQTLTGQGEQLQTEVERFIVALKSA